jgi:hypothetical protein
MPLKKKPLWKALKKIPTPSPLTIPLPTQKIVILEMKQKPQTLSNLPKTTFIICILIYSTYFFYMPSIFIPIPIPNNNPFGEGEKKKKKNPQPAPGSSVIFHLLISRPTSPQQIQL